MMSEPESKTILFTLRIWAKPIEGDHQEWRGKLQALPGGEAYYFQGWAALLERLDTLLATGEYVDENS
jgi:hypothetical protein